MSVFDSFLRGVRQIWVSVPTSIRPAEYPSCWVESRRDGKSEEAPMSNDSPTASSVRLRRCFNLDLQVGKPAYAVIKASNVMVAVDE